MKFLSTTLLTFSLASAFCADFSYTGDSPEVIITGKSTRNLKQLESHLEGSPTLEPWSGDYWALNRGAINFRYADKDVFSLYKKTKSSKIKEMWKVLFDQFNDKTAQSYIEQGRVNELSPAEKYDLLIGDETKTLSRELWQYGRGNYLYYRERTERWSWMGFCDGWANAAANMARPQNAVDVIAANGKTKITFYPDDIKALMTLLWSHGRTTKPLGRVGSMCMLVGNQVPNKTLRNQDNKEYKNCWDVNPGSLHLALMNQVGIHKKSFTIERTWDKEVWNHPVHSYRIRYLKKGRFRRQKQTKSFKDALIPIEESNRKLRAFRSERARYIVNVIADVKMMTETHPMARNTDDSNNDAYVSDQYLYDLELDENYNIVGGEWSSNKHPDYLGGISVSGTKAISQNVEFISSKWDGMTIVPQEYAETAKNFSRDGYENLKGTSKYMTPHSQIVDMLLEMSRLDKSQRNGRDKKINQFLNTGL